MIEPFIDTDEKLDSVVGTDLKIIQKIDGTAFAIDTLLICNFIKFNKDMNFAAELGSGSGILSFLIKYRNPALDVTGFEIQKEFYDLSIRNSKLNKHIHGLNFELMDVRDIPSRILPESYELVVSNPPYYPKGNGRLPSRPGRAMARHELNGTLVDFIEAAAYMLGYGGKLCMILPSERFYELSDYLKSNNFGLKRLQFVIPKEGEKSHLVMVEAEKFYNGKHEPLPNIIIRLSDGGHGPEVHNIMTNGLKKFG